MRKKLFFSALAVIIALSLVACSAEEPAVPVNTLPHKQLSRPELAENFYGYVNFDYIKNGQIPYDRTSIGTFDTIEDSIKDDISVIIDDIAKKDTSDPIESAVKEMYSQYLDTEARNKSGIDVFFPAIGLIDDCKSTSDLVKTMGVLFRMYGVSSFLRFEANPDFYDKDVNDLTLFFFNSCGNMKENFTKTSNGSEEMGQMLEDVLCALEVDKKEAKQRAKNVVALIYEIMKASMDSDSGFDDYVERHYHKYDKKDFSGLLSNIGADEVFDSFGFSADTVIVYDVSQVQKINELFTDDNLRELKDYVLLCTMYEYYNCLPPSMMKSLSELKNFDKDLEKSAKQFVCGVLENEVGIIYGRRICTDEVMVLADKMLSDVRVSCRELINNSDRLSDESRKKLLKKLDEMIILVGYDKDYKMPYAIKAAKDGGSCLENAIEIKRTGAQRMVASLSKKPDRRDWGMSPITANAQYNPMLNSAVIPAAMLSKASFDPSLGEYSNLGRLGYVIAHELNHAFDSNGVNYDEIGRYDKEWFTEADRKAYAALQEKAIDYYNSYKLLGVYPVDGELTLSENLADLGAMQCLAAIPMNREQLQQFFEGVAVQWAFLVSVEDAVAGLDQDVHSPAEARANAVVASVDKFYEAYDIKETDKMYVAPENRIKVW